PHLLSALTAPSPFYTLSLHDALPISRCGGVPESRIASHDSRAEVFPAPFIEDIQRPRPRPRRPSRQKHLPHRAHSLAPDILAQRDRKSTRLNSSHEWISYAVFCLKKK